MTDVTEEMNSLMSENSFVILGKGSLTHDLANDQDNSRQFSRHNGLSSPSSPLSMSQHRTSMGSMVTSSRKTELAEWESTNEIQHKLDQLVKENLLLKETLNQSNLAMKNQFDTLVLWHEEVVKTHESQKQKFQDTQEQIAKMRAENVSLKKLIEDNLDGCNGKCNAVFVNAENESVDILTKTVESLEVKSKEMGQANEQLLSRNGELEKALRVAMEEKSSLESRLEKALAENLALTREVEARRGKCTQCEGVITSVSCTDSVSVIGSGEGNMAKSLDPDMSVINKPTDSLGNQQSGQNESEMREELARLRSTVSEQLKTLKDDSDKMEAMKVQYEILLKDKKALHEEFKQQKTWLQQLREETKNLTAQLRIKEELHDSLTQELSRVEKEMQKLVLNCEEVSILRAQVEVYHADFEEERKAREQAVGEKEKMAERIRLLERTLTEMEKNWVKKEQPGGTPNARREDKEDEGPYQCPKCWKRFDTQQKCENHVYDCLDSDIFP